MHNKNMELDLFSLPDDDGASYGNKLDVVKMDFLSTETVTWKELFSGYDELHAITYSSGVNAYCVSKRSKLRSVTAAMRSERSTHKYNLIYSPNTSNLQNMQCLSAYSAFYLCTKAVQS